MDERYAQYSREDFYSQIYHNAEIYPPPIEHESIFLEIMSGCRYGKCLFCDFRRDKLTIYGLEDIERQLGLLRAIEDDKNRMHFLGCNPFFLGTEILVFLCEMTKMYLPKVTEINMYARADDINAKSDAELRELRAAGITDLHVGLESGSDEILAYHQKGETVADIERALLRLEEADIKYHVTMIPGLGGRQYTREHAVKTAEMLSRLHPDTIWCISLKLWENTPLYDMAESGSFEPLTPHEILGEERDMVSRLNLTKPCHYVDSTVLQKYTLSVMLPEGKESLLKAMDQLLSGELRPGE